MNSYQFKVNEKLAIRMTPFYPDILPLARIILPPEIKKCSQKCAFFILTEILVQLLIVVFSVRRIGQL